MKSKRVSAQAFTHQIECTVAEDEDEDEMAEENVAGLMRMIRQFAFHVGQSRYLVFT